VGDRHSGAAPGRRSRRLRHGLTTPDHGLARLGQPPGPAAPGV
jgi:hypothetical protein